jgi:hypothetical protein
MSNKICLPEKRLIIPLYCDLTEWEIEYIIDCWVQFVTQDLGYSVSELPMYIDEIRGAVAR